MKFSFFLFHCAVKAWEENACPSKRTCFEERLKYCDGKACVLVVALSCRRLEVVKGRHACMVTQISNKGVSDKRNVWEVSKLAHSFCPLQRMNHEIFLRMQFSRNNLNRRKLVSWGGLVFGSF